MVLQQEVKVDLETRQQVKFEATDHGDSVLAGLKQLREKELLFDVVLLVEGQRFPAHRVVLASCCDYFRAMFTDGLRESNESEIELNGVTAKGLKNLLDFAYSSKILLDFDNVEDILLSANHVQMVPVIAACANFLKAQLSLENCVDMLNMAELFSMKNLREIILRFMCSNLTKLAQCASFYHKLPYRQLLLILNSDFPVDCSELEVLHSVLDWIAFQFDQRVQYAHSLLSLVHTKDISQSELSALPNISVLEKVLDLNPSIQRILTPRQVPRGETTPTESGLTNHRGFCQSLVCVGGFSPKDGMSNEIHYYHAKSHSWRSLSVIPHVNQCNFGLAILRNELYVIGGCFNDQIQEVVHQYGFCYNPEKNTWRSIAPLQQERCRFYLGALKGKLYAIGGDPLAGDVTELSAPCECYDPEQNMWNEIAPLPGNRAQHAGIVHQGHLYVSGGLQDLDDEFYSSFYKYNPDSDSWTELCPLPSPRADHTMFEYKSQIHCIGGWYESEILPQRILISTIDRYNSTDDSWETIATVPEPRLFATYTLMNNSIYVVGGWLKGLYQDKAKSVQVYNLAQNMWSENQLPNIEVWEHGSCTLYVPN